MTGAVWGVVDGATGAVAVDGCVCGDGADTGCVAASGEVLGGAAGS